LTFAGSDELLDGLLADAEQGSGVSLVVVALGECAKEKLLAGVSKESFDGKAGLRLGQCSQGIGMGDLVGDEEVGGFENIGASVEDGALEDIRKLADISGPMKGLETAECVFRKLARALAALVDLLKKGESELRDLGATVAKCGQANLNNFEAEVEVFTETAFGDFSLEFAIGGGHDANVDPAGARAADALDDAVLDDAKKLGLDVEREFRDFVEEESGVVGGFEEAGLVGVGAGEGALGVAEEIGLGEGFRDGGAVDGDELSGSAGREAMNKMSEALFTSAGFAGEEDGEERFGGDGSLLGGITEAGRADVEVEFEESVVEGEIWRPGGVLRTACGRKRIFFSEGAGAEVEMPRATCFGGPLLGLRGDAGGNQGVFGIIGTR